LTNNPSPAEPPHDEQRLQRTQPSPPPNEPEAGRDSSESPTRVSGGQLAADIARERRQRMLDQLVVRNPGSAYVVEAPGEAAEGDAKAHTNPGRPSGAGNRPPAAAFERAWTNSDISRNPDEPQILNDMPNAMGFLVHESGKRRARRRDIRFELQENREAMNAGDATQSTDKLASKVRELEEELRELDAKIQSDEALLIEMMEDLALRNTHLSGALRLDIASLLLYDSEREHLDDERKRVIDLLVPALEADSPAGRYADPEAIAAHLPAALDEESRLTLARCGLAGPYGREQALASVAREAGLKDIKKIERKGKGGMGEVYGITGMMPAALAAKLLGMSEAPELGISMPTPSAERILARNRDVLVTLAAKVDKPHLPQSAIPQESPLLLKASKYGLTPWTLDHRRDNVTLLMKCVRAPIDKWLLSPSMTWAEKGVALFRMLNTLNRDAGIVHRDLKPSNIMMGPDGTPRVIDFGLAEELPAGGARTDARGKGTPDYMAAEALCGHPRVSEKLDVESMGRILYDALNLTGTREDGSLTTGAWSKRIGEIKHCPDSAFGTQTTLLDNETRYKNGELAKGEPRLLAKALENVPDWDTYDVLIRLLTPIHEDRPSTPEALKMLKDLAKRQKRDAGSAFGKIRTFARYVTRGAKGLLR
jgi:hypothetical protein